MSTHSSVRSMPKLVIKKAEKKGYTYYKTPKWPDYPYDEWQSRIAKARKLMVENKGSEGE